MVLSLSSFATGVLQYPKLVFNVENTVASPIEGIHLSIRGNGKIARMVEALSFKYRCDMASHA